MATFDKNDDGVVVIIGSGAGGGTLGTDLALKGIKTVILEAGSRHEIEDFIITGGSKQHPGSPR